MASVGWGQESPTEPDTKIAQTLISYAMRGGALYSARRWVENPLTLTHALWQSPDGDTLEAFRPPDDDLNLLVEERDAWIQVAILTTSSAAPGPTGRAAPWLPVQMEPTLALELGQRIQQARAARQRQRQRYLQQQQAAQQAMQPPSYGPPSYAPHMPSPTPGAPQGPSRPAQPIQPPTQPLQRPPNAPPQRPPSPPQSQWGSAIPTASSPWREASSAESANWPSGSAPTSSQSPLNGADSSGWTGNWRAGMNTPGGQGGVVDSQEVTTLVSIEVDMPLMPGDGLADDYVRDFARDVTIHFSRAARTLSQTRDLRGWMRGGRIVLAARLAVGTGARAPTRAEMEHAAHLLADALAHRTLPYTRLTFPDPNEWAQGLRLPDAG